ncbi:TQO small subunit DoxD [Arthrobacter sp. UYEF3]|uniref:TQO small subunit DoxD n=1 Tax=Arthrobacter sp. UYEF3 TaxID=1756365 RepID=UPI00339A0DE7
MGMEPVMAAKTTASVEAGGDARLRRGGVAALRIGVALLWIQNVAWKVPPDFGEHANTGLYFFTHFAVDHPVFPPYSWFVEHVVLANFPFFGWMTLLIEAGLGAFLLIGLATRFWAVIGLAQSLAIMLSVLNAPNEWHWSYYLMILAHVGIFATAAGRSFGIDGVLRPGWMQSTGRLGALLVRLS